MAAVTKIGKVLSVLGKFEVIREKENEKKGR
jgi:hypothetical protein